MQKRIYFLHIIGRFSDLFRVPPCTPWPGPRLSSRNFVCRFYYLQHPVQHEQAKCTGKVRNWSRQMLSPTRNRFKFTLVFQVLPLKSCCEFMADYNMMHQRCPTYMHGLFIVCCSCSSWHEWTACIQARPGTALHTLRKMHGWRA